MNNALNYHKLLNFEKKTKTGRLLISISHLLTFIHEHFFIQGVPCQIMTSSSIFLNSNLYLFVIILIGLLT
jgi:hypothetical protein